ncbi:hypothetical protein [Lactococcus garvieae]|uniref:Uncharacterized protein n=1 Tax=Lactococcus garvieae TaxID=1363 RepID=A0A1I4GI54_9LACT|nr:hypothetical protein [Lactococcus garvieae]SFL29190.1 hypothetical protein SAMN05216438_10431 [Lactococcus garvieae]
MKRLILNIILTLAFIKLVSLFSPSFANMLADGLIMVLNLFVKAIFWLEHLVRTFLTYPN